MNKLTLQITSKKLKKEFFLEKQSLSVKIFMIIAILSLSFTITLIFLGFIIGYFKSLKNIPIIWYIGIIAASLSNIIVYKYPKYLLIVFSIMQYIGVLVLYQKEFQNIMEIMGYG